MLNEKIKADLKNSMKQKEELTLSVLRMLSAAIVNKEKEKRFKSGQSQDIALTDEEIIEVIATEIKKRKEAALAYEQGDRKELSEKEKKEAEILQQYLPEQLSEAEVKKLVKTAIEKVGAKTQKDMGKVMQELMPKVKGKADGSLVSKLVKDLLSQEL